MKKFAITSTGYVVVASVFSIVLSYIFGNDGYESMLTSVLALGLLLTFQLIGTIKLLLKSNVWPLFKFASLPLSAFLWCAVIIAIMQILTNSLHPANVAIPTVSWPVVVVGIIPFALQRLLLHTHAVNLQQSLIGVVASVYSVLVFYLGVAAYFMKPVGEHTVILVLAAQLQFIMTHIVIHTNYMTYALRFSNNVTRRVKIDSSTVGTYMTVLLVGLPFLAPLFIMMAIGF